jgi:hypothetical protein
VRVVKEGGSISMSVVVLAAFRSGSIPTSSVVVVVVVVEGCR